MSKVKAVGSRAVKTRVHGEVSADKVTIGSNRSKPKIGQSDAALTQLDAMLRRIDAGIAAQNAKLDALLTGLRRQVPR